VGDVTIDGVYYPATAGTNVYLSDKAENVTVTVTVGQPGVASSQRNYVTIVTPNYTISEFYYNVGMGYIALTASNALLLWPRMHDAVILINQTPVRVAPVPMGDTAFVLPEAETVTITAEHEDFALIRTRRGLSGWVARANLGAVVPQGGG